MFSVVPVSQADQFVVIRDILVERDGITKEEADEIILEAREMLTEYLEEGDVESAANICEEYFALEQDYLLELLP